MPSMQKIRDPRKLYRGLRARSAANASPGHTAEAAWTTVARSVARPGPAVSADSTVAAPATQKVTTKGAEIRSLRRRFAWCFGNVGGF
eukprot:CAMPEP_0170201698 /NCGR_PEP_ID=MMETSP0116_2-20130129/308_1 /TAXON_ID=400756 /ORGANISM="Durinskia baltica, Strain CSIRO CS-38" /LENGTH=87 /DNA_ID=CAMNT_0010451919 /DNA_START=22 /DNA_END=282 /DNA_ORIENTATION=-